MKSPVYWASKEREKKHAEYVIANHILKLTAYFCNSDKQKVQALDYPSTITNAKARAFVDTYYPVIEQQARVLLGKMNKGEIDITHDFYLKKFQLSSPQLPYDYILFDEGQDASATMLDVFLKQPATKVIVGDTHQQIYGWRFAINSLEKVGFETLQLSNSFRFGPDIARVAREVLTWKEQVSENTVSTKIEGKGQNTQEETQAVIGRTNLGLLIQAIDWVSEYKKINSLYFEGNFKLLYLC